MSRYYLLAAPAVLMACATQYAGTDSVTATMRSDEIVYRCGAVTARARLSPEGMTLVAGGETFSLRRAVAASGEKYEAEDDPSTSFWTKGETALMSLRGETFSECVEAGERTVSLPAGFSAGGNEPGWRVEFGEREITLVTNYGEKSLTIPRPAPVPNDGGLRYAQRNERIIIDIERRVCADDATGMPHPYAAVVEWDGATLRGCGGEPRDLLLGDWTVAELDGAPPAENTLPTLRFDEENRVSGRAFCNSFSAVYELTGEGLAVARAASTMMACPEPLMAQERLFLDILANAQRFEITENFALLLHADNGRTIRARRQLLRARRKG